MAELLYGSGLRRMELLRQHFVSADHADGRGLEEEKENNLRESAKSADRHAKKTSIQDRKSVV